jgi:glycosyltransferase involved in cell wall biosynthesis
LTALRELYPASVRAASTVFTISEFSRQALIRAYGVDPAKVVVVPLDVDDVFRRPQSIEERRAVRSRHGVPDRYVLYPAITWPHKNHRALLHALRAFNARRKPLTAVFTGSPGPGHRALLREIDRLDLSQQAMVLGHIPNVDLASLYQDALALVFPSLFEGFGLPILEGFHSGCPVICSETTSCPETAGDAALYIAPDDPETIVNALARLDASAELREELIGRGRERAARFSWAEAGRLTFDAIRAAVEDTRRPIVVESDWPSITVVTPSFNQAKFIAETIESVLAQNYPNLEYIVMDGGSTDGTLDILRRYGERLHWVSEPDRGQADAVNKAVALGHGEIIGWLNSDDTYAPGALERAARAFARWDDLAVMYGDADHVLEDGTRYAPYPTASFDHRRLAEDCFICQPAAFVRRKFFNEAGGLDPSLRFCMDYDLWIRMGRDHRFAYLPEVLAQSRLHKDAKTFAARGRVFQEIIQTVQRHYGFVPFAWAYAYADHVFNRSPREVFQAKRRSVVACAIGVLLTIWLNRGKPAYCARTFRQAARSAKARLSFAARPFEGRWSDGWISKSFVSQVVVSPGTTGIAIRGRHAMPGRRRLMLSVFVNDVSAGAHVLPKKGPFTIHAPCPPTDGYVTVEIVADRVFRPLYRGHRDGRLLSCIIDDVSGLG